MEDFLALTVSVYGRRANSNHLSFQMNDEPLPDKHGYPVRVVVPGAIGARSVKWLDRITVSRTESQSFYQQRDYKLLPSAAVCSESAKLYWGRTPSMLDVPVNCCVAVPTSDSSIHLLEDGTVRVIGYAVPQGEQGPIVRVQVSGDDGRTWIDARFEDEEMRGGKWTWCLWNCDLKMQKGWGRRILAKATDSAGNTQEHEKSSWNLRGVGYNGYEAVFGLEIL